MREFKEITPEQFVHSPFHILDKEWMLITAGKDEKTNTMTASWGGFGVLWNKNVAYIFIRPTRYTKEFVDHSDSLSLSFFDPSYKKQLGYLGRVSGRDVDKIKESGLTVIKTDDGTPYFEEAKMTLFCKKLYAQELKPECFIVDGLDEKNYPLKDYHTMYVVEIERFLVEA
ncbi:MAG TPA: flavin reductase family protein [Desulfitobacterium dehalogenans]|uniref:Flavin reductase family protein n=1 Tax=Desulfitobacterium dehalogenans TaxID=36854 RepID=A0A7C7D997_9FIRM|nr:flavin reductase family protein [Desulfitobacterium dehalogenans]